MENFYIKSSVSFIAGIILIIFLGYLFFIQAPKDFQVGIIVNIPEGTSLQKISHDFKDGNLIRSRIMFEAFVISYGGEKRILPGDYLFEKKLSVEEVARRISTGKRNLAPIKLTIPEGYNIREIIEISSIKIQNFNRENFLTLTKDKEGYLFPDTYFFFTTDNEQDLFDIMIDNYEKKVSPLRTKIISLGKTEKEIIIMASIIEREAIGDIDRGYISGILWNRLKIGMALQVDAAPLTYKVKGLPESPISNPGLLAINASMYPQSSPYLFYLHGKDGKIHYAKTFDEHRQNKLKYLK
ncbi:MAG: Aminodeoxychorismate lyase [Candidatus Nomurabacteria bacterium GW2011_GWA2_40_9]|uniref:Endolytic murein transglycosylase n=1 Tax=Candidatus Nomurabacteria bacterium GW2011_GWA2_40_9 TaxID=1618734 RepID=A0A0G0TNN2_9BACT|nr:MAG: Aminodeoxychorismate lyase [Candidatus Nomurabacteria bacterium GW2011_GWA2_40_9]